jgi:predicted benzoate:H+ symporter BenE
MGATAAVQAASSADQIQSLERRLASLRNIAVAGMGLAFGIGGFLGLVAGLVVMALVRRPHADHDERGDA